LREALPAHASRQLPDLGFQPNDGLRRDAPPRLPTAGEAEAHEFADARSSDRALGLVDFELEALGEEMFDIGHDPLAHPLTAHIDVAVVGVAHEAMAAILQFLISTSMLSFHSKKIFQLQFTLFCRVLQEQLSAN
jgi:hypothetical protein